MRFYALSYRPGVRKPAHEPTFHGKNVRHHAARTLMRTTQTLPIETGGADIKNWPDSPRPVLKKYPYLQD
jgi:hypothetical protein